jgi:hypothetical protein
MGDWIATAVFGSAMGVQAALIAGGRAALPAVTGFMHDELDGYRAAMVLLTALLLASTALVATAGRRARPHEPA